jgi:hypothetical protein
MMDCFDEILCRLAESVEYALPPPLKSKRPEPIWLDGWKKQLVRSGASPRTQMLDGLRFQRVVGGRYWFYRNAPPFFESERLMRRELHELRTWRIAPFLQGVLADLRLDIPFEEALDGPFREIFDVEIIDATKRLLVYSHLDPKPVGKALWKVTDELIPLIRTVYPAFEDYFRKTITPTTPRLVRTTRGHGSRTDDLRAETGEAVSSPQVENEERCF